MGRMHPGRTVALSTLAVLTRATVRGAGMPMALKRVGCDPTTVTAPFPRREDDVVGSAICLLSGHGLTF